MVMIEPSEDLVRVDVLAEKNRILNEEQLDACAVRMQRLKDALAKYAEEKKPFNLLDLLFEVDVHAKAFYEGLQSDEVPQKTRQHLERFGPFNILGRKTPEEVKVEIKVPEKKPPVYPGHYRRDVSPLPSSRRTLSPSCRAERKKERTGLDSPVLSRA